MLVVKIKLSFIHSLAITRDTQREELSSSPPVQYLNNKSHGQNLSPTSGKAQPFVQYFFKHWIAGEREGDTI
jgi:hypothetical protein